MRKNPANNNQTTDDVEKFKTSIQDQLSTLQNSLESNQREKDELSAKVASLENISKKTTDDAGPTPEEIRNDLIKKNEELAQQIKILSQKFSSTSAPQQNTPASEDQESRIKEIEKQLQEAKKTASAAEEKSGQAEKKAKQAQQDIDAIKPKIKALTEQLQQQDKKLSETEKELTECKKSINESKDKQQKIVEELKEEIKKHGSYNNPTPQQAASPSQQDPQDAPESIGDLKKQLQQAQKRIRDDYQKVATLEEDHADLDSDNKKLRKKQEALQGSKEKLSQVYGSPKFFVETTDKLKTGADQLDKDISTHSGDVKKLTERLEDLRRRIADQESDGHDVNDEDDNYTPEKNAPTLRKNLANTELFKKANGNYGEAWEEAADLIEKQSSLQLLKQAQSLLGILKKRNFEDTPEEPIISVKINGQFIDISPPSEWLKNLPEDEYEEIISQAMEAVREKKMVIKNDCGNLNGKNTKKTLQNIAIELENIKTRLKKEKKDIIEWEKDIDTLKKYFAKYLVVEIDDSYRIKK